MHTNGYKKSGMRRLLQDGEERWP
eukprot:COSAG06_NODE_2883_length_6137_cov_3.519377_2_plen_23_part_01